MHNMRHVIGWHGLPLLQSFRRQLRLVGMTRTACRAQHAVRTVQAWRGSQVQLAAAKLAVCRPCFPSAGGAEPCGPWRPGRGSR